MAPFCSVDYIRNVVICWRTLDLGTRAGGYIMAVLLSNLNSSINVHCVRNVAHVCPGRVVGD
jgi:hypothetical protein